MESNKRSENRILWTTVFISSVLLGSLLFALDGIFHHWIGDPNRLGRGIKVGLSLLIFWLVVTASLRSVNRLAAGIAGFKLLVGGVAIAVLGTLLSQLILHILIWFEESWAPDPNYGTFLFYGIGGMIASVISLINLRTPDKRVGNILEVIIIIVVALLFFYFAIGNPS